MSSRGDCKSLVSIPHPTGRQICARIFGSTELQRVVVYSHGFPACGYEAALAAAAAKEANISILALDRSGYGGSSYYPNRQAADWASDVEIAANHLGIDRFAILAVSGGVPTGVAAAALLPDRVTALSLVSGVAPVYLPGALDGMNIANRSLIRIGQRNWRVGRKLVSGIAYGWRRVPALAGLWFGALLPAPDRLIVWRPEVRRILARNLRVALRPGIQGVVQDFHVLISQWHELLCRVQVPTRIWHGDADTYVPVSMSHILNSAIPGSECHIVSGGGHFMIADRIPEILALTI